MELDGRVVTESGVIMNLLEEAFPDHTPLMPPAGSPQRARADALMRLERRSVRQPVGQPVVSEAVSEAGGICVWAAGMRVAVLTHTGAVCLSRWFGDWLNWLCSGWNQQSAQAGVERTLEAMCKELTESGVRGVVGGRTVTCRPQQQQQQKGCLLVGRGGMSCKQTDHMQAQMQAHHHCLIASSLSLCLRWA